MLTFYYTPDTCALASHIALEDAGANFSLHHVDFENAEQSSSEFLKINPKGRVPALVTPSGVITETPSILAYVAQSYPGAQLAPLDNPFAFAQIQSFNSYICSTLHVAHAHRMRGYRWADEDDAIAAMQRKVPEAVSSCYEFLEHHALVGPFVLGKAYSIADPYLFTVAQWMEADGVDPEQFPKVKEHRQMMRQRPSVQKALSAEM